MLVVIDVGSFVGRRLRHYRQLRGRSVDELALKLGTHPSQVRGWELGRRTPNLLSLSRIARELDVELAALLPSLAELGGGKAPHATQPNTP